MFDFGFYDVLADAVETLAASLDRRLTDTSRRQALDALNLLFAAAQGFPDAGTE